MYKVLVVTVPHRLNYLSTNALRIFASVIESAVCTEVVECFPSCTILHDHEDPRLAAKDFVEANNARVVHVSPRLNLHGKTLLRWLVGFGERLCYCARKGSTYLSDNRRGVYFVHDFYCHLHHQKEWLGYSGYMVIVCDNYLLPGESMCCKLYFSKCSWQRTCLSAYLGHWNDVG